MAVNDGALTPAAARVLGSALILAAGQADGHDDDRLATLLGWPPCLGCASARSTPACGSAAWTAVIRAPYRRAAAREVLADVRLAALDPEAERTAVVALLRAEAALEMLIGALEEEQ